jgi:hypothetical protein
MITWIIALSVLFQFCLGAMLPLLPAIAPEDAGIAFSAFSLMKVAFLVPAGRITDRIGHARAVTLTLVFQVAALALIALFPERPWIGRVLEGMALAQGTVSTVSLLRVACAAPGDFERAMGRLMGAGSVGFLFGPLVGYAVVAAATPRALVVLLVALTAVALTVQLALERRPASRGARRSPEERMRGGSARSAEGDAVPTRPSNGTAARFYVILGLAAAKMLSIAWQPNLAWWNTHEMAFGPLVAAATFLVMGVAFALGAWLRARVHHALVATAGILGFALLEASIRGSPWAWWPSALLMGFWFGGYLTRAIARLGWNRPEHLGRTNSTWMIMTDLPMALGPWIVWHWRAPEPGMARLGLGFALLAVASVGIAIGDRRRVETA